MRKQNAGGFTIVELLIVVSIIGILASVSSVYFEHYRSKSKSTEAKLLLSSIYTSQEIFKNAYGFYSNCLGDMGFEISESSQRFYAVGFPSITAAIPAVVHDLAVKNGLPVGTCSPTGAPAVNETFFLAGKGAGQFIVNNTAAFTSALASTSNALDEVGGPQTTDVEEGLGDQTVPARSLYTVPAFGYINIDFSSPANGSLWTIDSNKLLKQHRKGF